MRPGRVENSDGMATITLATVRSTSAAFPLANLLLT
jgi:hypothetical protein